MNADQFIHMLGEDAAARPPRSMEREWRLALAGGLVVAALMLLLALRVRADLAAVIAEPRFLLKFAATIALAAPAWLVTRRLAHPGADFSGALGWLLIAPAIVALACIVELFVTPASSWPSRLIGANAAYCVALIPFLSLAPLAATFIALARGATTRPRLAGLCAGLAAGGVGAMFYAAHCTDDSPLFLMVWYTMGIAIVAAAGAWLGPRFLRW